MGIGAIQNNSFGIAKLYCNNCILAFSIFAHLAVRFTKLNILLDTRYSHNYSVQHVCGREGSGLLSGQTQESVRSFPSRPQKEI